jgi:hypothetical protein
VRGGLCRTSFSFTFLKAMSSAMDVRKLPDTLSSCTMRCSTAPGRLDQYAAMASGSYSCAPTHPLPVSYGRAQRRTAMEKLANRRHAPQLHPWTTAAQGRRPQPVRLSSPRQTHLRERVDSVGGGGDLDEAHFGVRCSEVVLVHTLLTPPPRTRECVPLANVSTRRRLTCLCCTQLHAAEPNVRGGIHLPTQPPHERVEVFVLLHLASYVLHL